MKNLSALLAILCLVVSCGKSNSAKEEADAGGSFDPKPIPVDPVPIDPKPIAHNIGEFYQGGIIFWIDTTKLHGLIAATHDQAKGVKWAKRAYNTGATLDGIGAGKNNTGKIISTFGPSFDYAASIAASCNEGGYNDWYLPSKTELDLMLKQSKIIGEFDTSNYLKCNQYWSSTESGGGLAWSQIIGNAAKPWGEWPCDNSAGGGSRITGANVRAIRSF